MSIAVPGLQTEKLEIPIGAQTYTLAPPRAVRLGDSSSDGFISERVIAISEFGVFLIKKHPASAAMLLVKMSQLRKCIYFCTNQGVLRGNEEATPRWTREQK